MNILSVISPNTHEDFKDGSTFLKGGVWVFRQRVLSQGPAYPAVHPCYLLLLDAVTPGFVRSSPSGCVSHW